MFLLRLQVVIAAHDNLGIWEDAGYEVNKNVKRDKNIDFLICPLKGGQVRTPIKQGRSWLTRLVSSRSVIAGTVTEMKRVQTDWKIQVSVLKIK